MRGVTAIGLIAGVGALACLVGPTRTEAAAPTLPHHIVGPSRTIEPGETVDLRLAPPVEGDPRRISWRVVSGSGVASRGRYSAPFIVTQEWTRATLRVVRKDDAGVLETIAEETLRLHAGAVPGADACLGPGQRWDEGGRGFVQTESTDDIASVLATAQPEYPAQARARGISGVVPVHALVCRSGRVLHAWIPATDPPQPELEILHEAALEAARRYAWRPPTIAGQPVAFHAAMSFRFPPP